MRILVRSHLSVVATVLLLALAACGAYPADPHGTLERVTGGVLRVGVVHNEPYVSVTGPSPSGTEVDLVTGYAEQLGATIEWTAGNEGELVSRVEHGQVDLVIGGLAKDTPWQKKVGLTQPYATSVDQFGAKQQHVMAVRLGENAFLLDLDRYLQAAGGLR